MLLLLLSQQSSLRASSLSSGESHRNVKSTKQYPSHCCFRPEGTVSSGTHPQMKNDFSSHNGTKNGLALELEITANLMLFVILELKRQ